MPSFIELSRCLRVAVRAARQAGALLTAHIGKPLTVETKRNIVDLVTNVDRASERLIRRTLMKAFPTHGFLGEESGRLRETAPYQWIVDPIDGTTNFVHGMPLFGVSIGLLYHHTAVAGVIYDPMRRELFTAQQGRGAFLNGRRITVSGTRRVAQSLLSTGFASSFRERPQPYLNQMRIFEANSHAVRRIGSTVLSLAYVAAGRLDGFYEQRLWPWDIAAGLLLVQEAGGWISDFHGQPPTLTGGELVASNRRIHQEILGLLARVLPRRRTGRRAARRRSEGRR